MACSDLYCAEGSQLHSFFKCALAMLTTASCVAPFTLLIVRFSGLAQPLYQIELLMFTRNAGEFQFLVGSGLSFRTVSAEVFWNTVSPACYVDGLPHANM